MSRGRRTQLIALVVVVALFGATSAAYAYFTANNTGNGAASADTVNTGATPTGSASGSTVTLNWAASTTAVRAAAVSGYVITRYTAASGGTGAAAGGTCTGTVAALTCNDTGLADGTYYYSVTPKLANWLGNESATRGGPFTVSTTVATKLSFTTQPSSGQNIQATGTGSFNVSVAVQTAGGTTVTSDTRNVTLAISNNAGPGGVLSCSNVGGLTVAAVSGVANFTGCAITKVGTGYTLTATSSPSLTAPTNANTFNITAGSATQLVFTTQPVGGVTEGTNFGTQPVVKVEDTNGNVVTSDTGSVTLAINTYAAGNGGTTQGTLGCTNNTVTAVAGVATFAACKITGTAGAGTYTLVATRSGLTSTGASNNLVITADVANKLGFTTCSFSNTTGTTTCSPVGSATVGFKKNNAGGPSSWTASVTLYDSFGNVTTNVTGSAMTVTVTKSNGSTSLTFSSGTSLTIPNGSSQSTNTFTHSNAGAGNGGGSDTVTAARAGLTSAIGSTTW